MIAVIEELGRSTNNALAMLGDFSIFSGRTLRWLSSWWLKWKNLRQLLPLIYEIGVRSIPMIGVTGAFIGMVMAVETFTQFKSIGQEERIGAVISLSVVKQIGPVLAAVMLAGRIGGALTAELGTMNVTEQLDALRVMGADPIRYLVVPRFLVCLLLLPVLTIYSDFLGILGGWMVATRYMGIANQPFWSNAAAGVETWQIMEGVVKSFFFGGAIGLVSCYKGFTCGAGASGVGRACTESFVISFVAIIVLNFFFAQLSQSWYTTIFGIKSLFSQGFMALIELQNISKRFGRLVVLRHLDLAIEKGHCIVVIGASGTGKSVLLKHIVGLLRPDEGKIFFDGKRTDPLPERELMKIRERFGFLFQMGALFDSLNVEQNVAFPLVEHTTLSPEEISQRVNDKLRMVGLPDARKKMPMELSGGQRKRVALARAIALDPEVILYDEPTTGLDPVRSDVINELIIKLQRELKVTSVVVTHDMASAFKVGDRIVMLHEGRIVFDGTPEQIKTTDNETVKRFVMGEADEQELAELKR